MKKSFSAPKPGKSDRIGRVAGSVTTGSSVSSTSSGMMSVMRAPRPLLSRLVGKISVGRAPRMSETRPGFARMPVAEAAKSVGNEGRDAGRASSRILVSAGRILPRTSVTRGKAETRTSVGRLITGS